MSHVQKIGHHRGIASGQRKQIQGFGLKRVVTHLSLGGMTIRLDLVTTTQKVIILLISHSMLTLCHE
jgi:hypothetical protein